MKDYTTGNTLPGVVSKALDEKLAEMLTHYQRGKDLGASRHTERQIGSAGPKILQHSERGES